MIQIKIRGGGVQYIMSQHMTLNPPTPGDATLAKRLHSFDRAERRRGITTHRQQKRARRGH